MAAELEVDLDAPRCELLGPLRVLLRGPAEAAAGEADAVEPALEEEVAGRGRSAVIEVGAEQDLPLGDDRRLWIIGDRDQDQDERGGQRPGKTRQQVQPQKGSSCERLFCDPFRQRVLDPIGHDVTTRPSPWPPTAGRHVL